MSQYNILVNSRCTPRDEEFVIYNDIFYVGLNTKDRSDVGIFYKAFGFTLLEFLDFIKTRKYVKNTDEHQVTLLIIDDINSINEIVQEKFPLASSGF